MSDQSDVRPSLEYDSFVVLVRFEGTVEKYTLVAFPSVLKKQISTRGTRFTTKRIQHGRTYQRENQYHL